MLASAPAPGASRAPAHLGWMRWPALLAFAALTSRRLACLGHGRLLAAQHSQAATSPVAPSCRCFRRDARFRRLRTGGRGRGIRARRAARLSRDAIPEPALDILERIAYLAQGVPGIVIALAFISLTVRRSAPLSKRRAAYHRLRDLFLPFALIGVRSALAQVQPGSKKPAARWGSDGSRLPSEWSRRLRDPASGPAPPWCSSSSPRS